jgi:hypothetical protein
MEVVGYRLRVGGHAFPADHDGSNSNDYTTRGESTPRFAACVPQATQRARIDAISQPASPSSTQSIGQQMTDVRIKGRGAMPLHSGMSNKRARMRGVICEKFS